MANIGVETSFEMHSGNHRTLEFTIRDENDAVVDITGVALAFAVSKLLVDSSPAQPSSNTQIFSKAVGSGITIVDGPNGRADVALVPADTAALKGDYYWELEMVDTSSNKTTPAFGTVTIYRDLITPDN